MKSWNEMRKAAMGFSKRWKDACSRDGRGTATVAALINGTVGDLFKDAAKSQPVGYDTFTVSGDMEKTYYLEGCNYSLNVDSECIRVTFQYGGATFTKDHKFTVVERIAEPITTERVNGQVVNPCCAILGESVPMLSARVRPLAGLGSRRWRSTTACPIGRSSRWTPPSRAWCARPITAFQLFNLSTFQLKGKVENGV